MTAARPSRASSSERARPRSPSPLTRGSCRSPTATSTDPTSSRSSPSMSREILEAMHALAVEKGIATDKLHDALEDALQSAYKKQPGAAKYARVEIGRASCRERV